MAKLPDTNRSRAVLIGSGRYQVLSELGSVHNNLSTLSRALQDERTWGLPSDNCVVVKDPVSAAELLDPIGEASREATDTLLVYYAGHGLIDPRRGELHLALAGSDPQRIYTAVWYNLIRDLLLDSRAERKIVILDCCYGGRALGQMSAGETIATEASAQGTYVLAAAAENKAAVAPPGARFTAFTGEFLGIIEHGIRDLGPLLDLDSIYRELLAVMREKGYPSPQNRDRNSAGQLAFVRNRAYKNIRLAPRAPGTRETVTNLEHGGVRGPTRALVAEHVETWISIFYRAARRAGASEAVVCENLESVRKALRAARFDIAILEIGLHPADELNADGIRALEMIREADGGATKCIIVTGWQGGDRLDLIAAAQARYGVDWAFMKENYDGQTVVAKLADLLDEATRPRGYQATPMESLHASMEPLLFERQLIDTISPKGGVQTIYSVVGRLVSPVMPLLAMDPDVPMKRGSDGIWVGVYWSRALAAAVAVGLAPVSARDGARGAPVDLEPFIPANVTTPDLIDQVTDRNVTGWVWEVPGVDIGRFPG